MCLCLRAKINHKNTPHSRKDHTSLIIGDFEYSIETYEQNQQSVLDYFINVVMLCNAMS